MITRHFVPLQNCKHLKTFQNYQPHFVPYLSVYIYKASFVHLVPSCCRWIWNVSLHAELFYTLSDVHVLWNGSFRTKIPKISVVEEVHDFYADCKCRILYTSSVFIVHYLFSEEFISLIFVNYKAHEIHQMTLKPQSQFHLCLLTTDISVLDVFCDS